MFAIAVREHVCVLAYYEPFLVSLVKRVFLV